MARQVELELEVQQVVERLPRDLAHGVLPDVRERRVQQLPEQRRADPRSAVCGRGVRPRHRTRAYICIVTVTGTYIRG